MHGLHGDGNMAPEGRGLLSVPLARTAAGDRANGTDEIRTSGRARSVTFDKNL